MARSLFISLSFFINHQFWIFTVFFVGTNQDEVHVGDDAEAAVSAEFAFQLVAEVGCVIVEEFDLLSVGECVFRINKRTGKILLFYQGAKHFKIFLANYLDVIHSTLNEINIIPQIVHQHCEARFC